MRVIIAGGRDYKPIPQDWDILDSLDIRLGFDEVVSGGARGADRFGEEWAASRFYTVKMFPADWEKHGRGAGHIRNEEMARYADAVILFTGGKGTENMYQNAIKYNLKIIDLR